MKKLHVFEIVSAIALASAFFSGCHGNAPAEQVPDSAPLNVPAGKKFDVLSRHDTDAVFVKTEQRRCRGLTSFCPDKCGHSGTVAVFRIEKYNAYEKLGEYGDPRTEEFSFMLQSTTGTSDVSKEIAARVRALEPGDKVRLIWEHIYVSDESGSKYPERVVRKLSPL